MKNRISFYTLVLGFFLFLGVETIQAQPQTLAVVTDTITNTEVDTVALSYVLDAKGDVYDVSYQIVARQLSGTTNLTAKHIVSNSLTGTNWTITTDSLDLDGASNGVITVRDVPNARAGLRIVGTGTQSTEYKIYTRLVRRE